MGAGRVAEPAVEAYLAEVAARLTGPRRARAAILDELRDGLYTAVAARCSRGVPAPRAVRGAIDDFGTPSLVAEAFAGELAGVQARRISGGYLLTGPLVGVSWLLLLAPPGWLQRGPAGLWTSIPALPLVGLAFVLGLVVLAGTGRLSRWFTLRPRRLVELTMLLGVACMAGDVMLLAVLAGTTAAVLSAAGVLAVVAAAASVTRLGASLAVLARCRRARTAVI